MKTYTYGYGIKVEDIRCDDIVKIMNFLKIYLHYRFLEIVQECTEYEKENKIKSGYDYSEFWKNWIENYEEDNGKGLAGLFCETMIEKYDFHVEYCVGNEFDAILYVPKFPWEMSKKERMMTKKQMESSFKRLLNELDINVEPREIVVEYDDEE